MLEKMSSKAKIPTCMICSRPGIPLGAIGGKEVIICVGCAEPLHDLLGSLIEAMKGPRPKPKRKVGISYEELKQMVAKAVEERGSAQLFEYCRRYGVSRKDARRLADELAAERGWIKEEAGGKLYIKKPEVAA
jgi:hypothetical protein